MRVKDSVVIWAKLKQGNGRGTCCWITHNTTLFSKLFILIQIFTALRGCLDINRKTILKIDIYQIVLYVTRIDKINKL